VKLTISIQIESGDASYSRQCADFMNDPSVSDWLKRAVLALSRRDPVDALGDVSLLMMLATQRIEEIERADERASEATAAAIDRMKAPS
jgi:hypothetical protein